MIIADGMLTISVLGMCAYGAYSAGWALLDLARGARLELWAELGLILFGPEDQRRTVTIVSMAYPVMYLTLSAWVTVKRTS